MNRPIERQGHVQGRGAPPAGRRLWLMRAFAAVLGPATLLVLAELVLRAAEYGLPSRFFVPCRQDSGTVFVPNLRYCEHFVPQTMSRAPQAGVLLPKGPSTIRIFVFGGSAANGDPEPAYGFCRQLEILLNQQSDRFRFEVINAAVTAMNSFVAARIAQDCARHDPDMFIVYMGNNEVIGPFGPSTLPGPVYRSHGLIQACITLQKDLRVGQLLRGLNQALGRSRQGRHWQGMEAFLQTRIAQTDSRLQDCYRHLRMNLVRIIRAARGCGACVLVCTVPTNIASCPPFGSEHGPGLTDQQRSQWERYFQSARQLDQEGRIQEALASYQKAYAIDPEYADLAYCLGRCLLATGRTQQAHQILRKARDLDTMRFRADSTINQILRQQVRQAGGRVRLLDLENELERANGGMPLGDGLLVDHVHLSVRGNFHAALAAVEAIGEMIPRARIRSPELDPNALFEQCCRRMLYDAGEAYRLARLMYYRKTRPPFVGQLDHATELASLRGQLIELKRRAVAQAQSESTYKQALALWPNDAFLVCRYGDYLADQARYQDAVQLYGEYLRRVPFDMEIRVRLAQALAWSGSDQQALAILTERAIPFHKGLREALDLLGAVYAGQGRYDQALAAYRRLQQIGPEDPHVLVNLASAASSLGDQVGAKKALDRALEMDPNSAPAMINMGNYYVRLGMRREAHDWFERAMHADPYNYIPRFSLGLQKLNLGQVREGLRLITEAVELNPDFVQGYDLLARTYAQFDKRDAARQFEAMRDLFSQ